MGRNKKRTAEEIRIMKRDAEKRRRARIKADPIKHAQHLAKEQERRKKRKEEQKTKTIADMTPREQRNQRKEWRERARKCNQQKRIKKRFLERLREDTPTSDSTHDEDQQNDRPVSPSILLRSFLECQQRRASTYTSSSSVASEDRPSLASTPSISSHESNFSRQKIAGMRLARKNRTIKDRIIENQKKAIEEMKKRYRSLNMRYKRLEKCFKEKTRVKVTHQQIRYRRNKLNVQRFLENDENSKICPGKKDVITRGGKKKQKRYLADTMINLHKKYNQESNQKISYATFARFRPFWIVTPKVSGRDTCLCVSHENFGSVTEKLKQLHLIKENTIDEICNSVVCNKNNFACAMKQCQECLNKTLEFATFDNSERITYRQWMVKTENRIIKGKEKSIKRTLKDSIECSQKDLIEKFLDMLPSFLKHKFNISHQYKAINQIKQNLQPGEALLHVDFSENFQCKYASETQSVHFGASRQQLSLHTCVLYYCNNPGIVKPISFCSVSECLRHDAAAIYAHLKKSLKELRQDYDIQFKKLHVLSDGPSGQYKNKTNFYLFTKHLVKELNVESATWNFSESGHGKGAVDGIGAVVKRTADSLVAHGQDIPDYNTFMAVMLCRTNVILYKVRESDMIEADSLVPKSLKTIPQTSKVHQLTWSLKYPNKIFLRKLSCTECSLQSSCAHFPVAEGFFEYQHTLSLDPPNREAFEIEAFHEEGLLQAQEESISRRSRTLVTSKKPDSDTEKRTASVSSWVVVQFEGKKKTIHFVGQVLSIEQNNQEISYVVKFLRVKNLESGIFIWQEPEDVSLVIPNDIVALLPEPTPTRRSDLVFKFDFINSNFCFR